MQQDINDLCSGFTGLTEEQLKTIEKFTLQEQVMMSMYLTDGKTPTVIARKYWMKPKKVANIIARLRQELGLTKEKE